jgi:hypothetical protein
MGQQMQEKYEAARDEFVERYHDAERLVSSNPGQSVLITFGIGFGLGLALTTLFTRPSDTWADRHLPDEFRRAPDALQHMAESLRSLPDAIARRLRS